jgi:hypothetical protein
MTVSMQDFSKTLLREFLRIFTNGEMHRDTVKGRIIVTSPSPTFIYRANSNHTKIPGSSLVKTDKLITKFILKMKGPRKAKTILKKNKAGRLRSGFKIYFKTTLIKTIVLPLR